MHDGTRGSPRLRFSEIFPGVKKPLIAMAHVPALPGTPLYAESEGVRGLVRHVRQEVSVLVDAGFDAVMFCNEHDRPYALKADLVASAVMARVVAECAPQSDPVRRRLPLGRRVRACRGGRHRGSVHARSGDGGVGVGHGPVEH